MFEVEVEKLQAALSKTLTHITGDNDDLNDFIGDVIKRKQTEVDEKERAVEAIRLKEDQRTRAQKAADLATKVAAEAEAAMETAKHDAEKKIKAAREALATVSDDETR